MYINSKNRKDLKYRESIEREDNRRTTKYKNKGGRSRKDKIFNLKKRYSNWKYLNWVACLLTEYMVDITIKIHPLAYNRVKKRVKSIVDKEDL